MTRDALDRYYTPRAAAQELLRELAPRLTETTYGYVVDPAAGRARLPYMPCVSHPRVVSCPQSSSPLRRQQWTS